ncbi:helix-turn-helix domain-containing protein [Gordonia sp. SCSIO 19800]|uniref:helix-turn-helix domain-containing protein n=1 Tax=Gordonia sp. SCSIO 19800 TaxID=2826926 RepID=UPI001B810C5E|nr:helix-turn-helix domain-containing protein [Gordonia sp. SCSIO 19800]MBR7194638.1 helix-turn-helix domain-containing protein [Gordonia sp. SCSIO 19800]
MEGVRAGRSRTRRPQAPKVRRVADTSRFGRLVQRRRQELGMSQSDVRLAGGPSDLTLRKIERGTTTRPDYVTLAKLDNALRWTPGSAGRAFEGGDPTPLPDPRLGNDSAATIGTRRPPTPITATEHGVFLRTDALADLTKKGRALDDLPNLSEGQAAGVSELRHAIDRLTRAWIVRQAEIARRRGSLNDLILVLDDHLRAPPSKAGTEQDQDDLRYLRWLAGYETPNPDDEQRYETRFSNVVEQGDS